MRTKGRRSEKLSIRMRNPCNRQPIPIHVRTQFFDSCQGRLFAENGIPLLKEPLRQLRDVFWMFNQIADSNSAHTDTLRCALLRRHCQRFDYRLERLEHWDEGLTSFAIAIGRSTRAFSDRRQLGFCFVTRHLMAPTPNGLDDLADCVDHQLRLLHLDGMAAVRVADVLCA